MTKERAREKKEGEGKQKRAAGMNVPISDPSLRVRLLRMRSLYLASGRFRPAKRSLYLCKMITSPLQNDHFNPAKG